jgi:hypothetical protein
MHYCSVLFFVAGGGGFGAAVANITLRKKATVVFEVYSPTAGAASPIAAVMFKVEPRGVWAMKGDSLILGSHGVLPEYLCKKTPKTPPADEPSRISVNLRYGLADNARAQVYWMSQPGNEQFADRMNACVCDDSSACVCAAEIEPPQQRTWQRPWRTMPEQAPMDATGLEVGEHWALQLGVDESSQLGVDERDESSIDDFQLSPML